MSEALDAADRLAAIASELAGVPYARVSGCTVTPATRLKDRLRLAVAAYEMARRGEVSPMLRMAIGRQARDGGTVPQS